MLNIHVDKERERRRRRQGNNLMAQSEPLQHSSNFVVDKPVETWNGKKVLSTTSQPSRAELQTSLICIHKYMALLYDQKLASLLVTETSEE